MIEATAKEIASEHQRTRRRARISSTDIVSQPVRVQLSRRKGARLGKNTISVARPSKWGNPFHVADVLDVYDGDKHAAHDDCVRSYEDYLTRDEEGMELAKHLHELKGRNLACWCKLNERCHADVLLRLANSVLCDTFAKTENPNALD